MDQENGMSDPMRGEVLKALVDKVVDIGKGINEVRETLRKFPDPAAAIQEIGKSIGEQGANVTGQGAILNEISEGVKRIIKQTAPDQSVEAVRQEIVQLRLLLEQPLKKEVHYRHFLGKPLLILIPAIIVIGVLSAFLVMSREELHDHAENDMKWRYNKLMADSVNLRILHSIDDKYSNNPEQFGRDVKEEEDRKQQLYENLSQVHRAEDEIQRLEKKKKLR